MFRALSDAGRAFIESEEGLRLKAYPDTGGVWTIAFGHTGPEVHPGLVITRQQADDLLKNDVHPREIQLNKSLSVEVSQKQFDSLFSFLYNCGLRKSVMDLVNSKSPLVTHEMSLFVHDKKGHLLTDLVERRKKECAMFLSDPWPFK